MVALETTRIERRRDYAIDVDDGTNVGGGCKGVGGEGGVHLGWFYGRLMYSKWHERPCKITWREGLFVSPTAALRAHVNASSPSYTSTELKSKRICNKNVW